MDFLNQSFALPLENPVLIFAVILAIILFAPILLNRIKIPHLIGLIIAGAIIGPHGFNVIEQSNITLFGKVGLLYIMFLAGLEIDMIEFKKNSWKSAVFGFFTFTIPIGLGFLGGYYLLEMPLLNAILLASIFASHTLIVYPILNKFGVAKNRAVNVAIGGTVITDTLALLVLAVIVKMTKGTVDNMFWIVLSVSIFAYGLVVIIIFPIICRWFFKRNDDNIAQYIFVLALLFLGAFLAEATGLEAIIGAFLVGLALNRLIPHTSPLMNRIEFVGNALFIPFFLIGVGMIVDYHVFKDLETIKVAVVMIVIATTAKFIAAWLTQKSFRFSRDERRLIFGLSNAQAAATLAVVLVGYNIELTPETIYTLGLQDFFQEGRLLSENILNGSILMILVTCTIASFVAQKGAQNIAMVNTADEEKTENKELQERILVPVNSIDNAEELINLSLTVKTKSNKPNIYALTVVDSNEPDSIADKNAKKILMKAADTAAAADVVLKELFRYDLNVVNGITSIVKEHRITDLILGLQKNKGISNNFLGNLTEGILTKSNTTTLIYKPFQPISTIKRHLIVVPDRAEKEMGFPFWLLKVWNIAKNTGAKLVFYSSEQTLKYVKDINKKHPVECEFNIFEDWDDFLILSRDVKHDDNLILVLSRRERPSYHANMTKIPHYLNKYFNETNFILVYPMQAGVSDESHNALKNPSVMGELDDLGKVIGNLFKKKLK